MEPKFFVNLGAWRDWLIQQNDRHTELLVGFHKKDSGKASITWPESVDGALCFGWVDGVRRRIDEMSYSVRFTPRKPSSTWSAVNIKRVRELIQEGQMHPAGIAAFEARSEGRTAIYSFEQQNIQFTDAQSKKFKASPAAWKFFQSQPTSYRRPATWWVISAKREETREKRLATLIETSRRGERLNQFSRKPA